MPTSHVFYDPSGQRHKVVSRSVVVLGLTAAVASTLFILSLLALPVLPDEIKRHHNFIPKLPKYDQRQVEAILQKTKRELATERAKVKRPTVVKKPSNDKIALAFYAPWQQSGIVSFEKYASKLTHVAPAWLALTEEGDKLNLADYDLNLNESNKDLINIARSKGVSIVPVLANSDHDHFDAMRLSLLLKSPEKQKAIVDQVSAWLVANKFDGVNIDFEEIPEDCLNQYVGFLKILRAKLLPLKKTLSVDIEASMDPKRIAEVADTSDWVMLMLYDQTSSVDKPGPIASLTWSERTLQAVANEVPENKLVLGVGTYAYDWKKGSDEADTMTFEDAMATAAGYRDGEPAKDVIEVDPESLNPRFEYTDDEGKDHSVWMLDAITAYNQWMAARDLGLRGIGFWVLGTEDPGVWSFVDRASLANKPDPSQLKKIEFAGLLDFVGKGEILSIKARPQIGQRSMEIDPDTGQAMDWTYDKYAFPYVMQKSGFKRKKLVLTFDDGPDPDYTPPILDKLKQLGVPGTFFMIGQNAEAHPDLVRRVYQEGNEVGNHSFTHPNMGLVSDRRALLEINATQRAIESIIGRSTVLFRPPYNADSQPTTPEQARPVEFSNRMKYLTVLENIDPHDWDTNYVLTDSSGKAIGTRKKTGQDIYNSVIAEIEKRAKDGDEGNMILLHDAGGDRSATVKALDLIVPELKRRGYTFTTVADLIDKTRDDVMPPIPDNEETLVGFDLVIFTISYWVEKILTIAFIAAIALGLGRSIFVTLLAWVSRRKGKRTVYDPAYRPTVTALIAAYNEEAVIVRTIESVLASEYPVDEIIVIDDGSKDATAVVVRAAFGNDPRVRLIEKPNGGKASALNEGIEASKGEVLVCIDADTQLAKDAIGKLVRHFDAPDVAAVAGNVRVGNADNLLTRWQSLEYTSSQNVDRRAYGLLNCITVVPGAIGAWRRSAVLEVGGYLTDTLAEDMDLTWRLRMKDYRLLNESEAFAYTEAPISFRGFFRQRFRWAYGTLQCLVKHRKAVGRFGFFGRMALPFLWLFQIVFQVLAPLIDLKVLFTVVTVWLAIRADNEAMAELQTTSPISSLELRSSVAAREQLMTVLVLYGLFFLVELIAAWLAYRWDRSKKTDLWYLFLQRFVYRQMMYGVVLKSLWRALTGGRQGWGKIQRTGTVRAR